MNTQDSDLKVFSDSDDFDDPSASDSSGSGKAPAASNIFFNSPDSNSSVTTSQPPTNSPLMNN